MQVMPPRLSLCLSVCKVKRNGPPLQLFIALFILTTIILPLLVIVVICVMTLLKTRGTNRIARLRHLLCCLWLTIVPHIRLAATPPSCEKPVPTKCLQAFRLRLTLLLLLAIYILLRLAGCNALVLQPTQGLTPTSVAAQLRLPTTPFNVVAAIFPLILEIMLLIMIIHPAMSTFHS